MRQGGKPFPAGGNRLVKVTLVGAVAASMLGTFGAAGAEASTLSRKQAAALRGVEVIGHRAAPHWGPENTMASIKHAIAVGADAVELDVMFTRDNKPVIIHDKTLDRTTNCTGSVAGRTWSKMRHCDAGSWFHRSFRGENIPKLSRALRKISRSSDMRVYLHMKVVENGQQARKITELVRRYDMDGKRTVAFADQPERLQRLDKAGFKKRHLGLIFNRHTNGWAKRYSRYGYLVPYRTPITAALVNRAHARGQKVIAVETSTTKLAALSRVGLDGFMANTLDATLDALNRVVPAETLRVKSLGGTPDPDRKSVV